MASPFAQKASNKEGEQFEMPPSGLHPAVLVGVIDLGTHEFSYQGKTSQNRKIFMVWELTAEHKLNGDTFVVAADYTHSLNKKANYRKMLEGWSGRPFSEDEEFDPVILLGKNCVVNISEGLTAGGKKFTEVASVAQPMKGQQVPKQTQPSFAWHMSQITCQKDEIPIPEWVPRNYGRLVVDDIKASKEWKALPLISPEYALDHPAGANGNTATLPSPNYAEPAF